ncbi:protein of unknown function [Rhodonellum ikkaensis]|nr:protein of unknown function [Rhodonellum ikkaensis]
MLRMNFSSALLFYEFNFKTYYQTLNKIMLLNPRLILIGMAFAISANSNNALAQSTTTLTLDSFVQTKGSWSEVRDAWTDPIHNQLLFSEGKGNVLINTPTKKNPGKDIVSLENFGDIELSLTYMLAAGSNSGIYIQGQYEIQLFDSWKTITPKAGDNGGIYQRWDDLKPEGQKGFQGYAPRQNVSKAPGIWQTLEVSFQAPRFSESGGKTQNARFNFIKLNGVVIHEDVELFGPTRGALKANEVAEGPIRIQGDHGPIAIQSLEIQQMNFPAPKISSIKYQVYPGAYTQYPAIENLENGHSGDLNSFEEFQTGVSGASLTKFEGNIRILETGSYTFEVEVPRGLGALQLGGDSGQPEFKQGKIKVEKTLSPGEIPYVLWVSKPRDWTAQGFFWSASAEGLWPVKFSEPVISFENSTDPIWVNADETPVLRSFIQLPNREKISHAVSVSGKSGIHFSYDLSTNQLIQVWRGAFLDATPMWNNRGNGVSLPLGVVTTLNMGESLLFSQDFTPIDKELKSSGYRVLGDGELIFDSKSETGTMLSDHLKLMDNGQGIVRNMDLKGSGQAHLIKVSAGKQLRKISSNLYLIADTGVYLQVLSEGVSPQASKVDSEDGIFLPITSKLSYAILF